MDKIILELLNKIPKKKRDRYSLLAEQTLHEIDSAMKGYRAGWDKDERKLLKEIDKVLNNHFKEIEEEI